MVTEIAVGIEIAEDRAHTSVATAGYMSGDIVLLELAEYVDGTDPLPTVLRLRAEQTLIAVAIDPHSPTATAVKPLTDAGITPLMLSTTDAAIAYGELLDALAAGRIRQSRQPELTAAVRAAQRRPMGGAMTWQRRGTDVDTSPLVACSLALWALQHPPKPPPMPWVMFDGRPTVGPPAGPQMGPPPGLIPRGPLAPPPTPRPLPGARPV